MFSLNVIQQRRHTVGLDGFAARNKRWRRANLRSLHHRHFLRKNAHTGLERAMTVTD